MVKITDIEDAIIEQLGKEIDYLKTVAPLSQFLRQDADEIAIFCPAVYVSYDSGTFQPIGTQYLFDREMIFTLVVVVRNFVSSSLVLHGDTTRNGIYDVLEDIRSALQGQTLEEDIYPLSPVEEKAITGDQNIAVYGISFMTRCRG